jgi:hypothetical protein
MRFVALQFEMITALIMSCDCVTWPEVHLWRNRGIPRHRIILPVAAWERLKFGCFMTLHAHSTHIENGSSAHIGGDAIFQDGDRWNESAHNFGCNWDRTEIPSSFVRFSNTSYTMEVRPYQPGDYRRHFLKMATHEPEAPITCAVIEIATKF